MYLFRTKDQEEGATARTEVPLTAQDTPATAMKDTGATDIDRIIENLTKKILVTEETLQTVNGSAF